MAKQRKLRKSPLGKRPIFSKGDFVKINKDIGVVVLAGEEIAGDSLDHTGVWFGETEKGIPVIWTIPTEYLARGPEPTVRH